MLYQILEWDTQFFGFTVAKLLPPRISKSEFAATIDEMQRQNVKLAYWASDPEDQASQACARSGGAFLADKKTTFVISSDEIKKRDHQIGPFQLKVEEYRDRIPTAELVDLAIQAGEFSRFRMDPRIPEDMFVKLYTLWITRSVSRELADAVFVIRSEGKVTGMVTVGEKAGRADIGLIAVDTTLRGQNAGTVLVQAAQDWGVRNNYSFAQVVTQGDNLPACRFYEKCGYKVEKVENIYHLWI